MPFPDVEPTHINAAGQLMESSEGSLRGSDGATSDTTDLARIISEIMKNDNAILGDSSDARRAFQAIFE